MADLKCPYCARFKSEHRRDKCSIADIYIAQDEINKCISGIRKRLDHCQDLVNYNFDSTRERLTGALQEISVSEPTKQNEPKGGRVKIFKVFLSYKATAQLTNAYFVISGKNSDDALAKVRERGYDTMAVEYLYEADIYLEHIDLQDGY